MALAPVVAILRALSRAMQRDLGSFAALKLNNFFLFVLFLVYSNVLHHLQPHSAYPFLLVVGFLLLFPMSSDPLAKIPAVRSGLWPLSAGQRTVLRLVSVAASPVFWITLALLFLADRSLALAFLGLAVAMQVVLAGARSPRWQAQVRLRAPGKLGPIMASTVRQMLSVLDTYLALLLSIAGCCYRFLFPAPDPAAFPIFALLIALVLSTYAQSLFGLDSGSAMTRYRLLPVSFRQISLAKDAAYLAILTVLVAPLCLTAGLTSGLIALAVGRYASAHRLTAQYRWRFTGGRMLVGLPQAILGFALGLAAEQEGFVFLAGAAAAYIFSACALSCK